MQAVHTKYTWVEAQWRGNAGLKDTFNGNRNAKHTS